MLDQLPPLDIDPIVEAYKRDVDVSLIRQNLRLSPHQRLEKLVEHLKFARELQRAGQAQRLEQ